MPDGRKRLTNAELIDYFDVYWNAFPDWIVEHEVVLVRSHGLLRQHIAFEALSYGAYRPSCSVQIVGPPDGSQLLFRFLDLMSFDNKLPYFIATAAGTRVR
jgi:hypothetical protein